MRSVGPDSQISGLMLAQCPLLLQSPLHRSWSPALGLKQIVFQCERVKELASIHFRASNLFQTISGTGTLSSVSTLAPHQSPPLLHPPPPSLE